MYHYAATILRVVDADTVDVDIDLGLDVHTRRRLRLWGVDAPEKRTPEGKAAMDWVCSLLRVGDAVIVRTFKDRTEKYGRYLATIEAAPRDWEGTLPIDISSELLRAGHARPLVTR